MLIRENRALCDIMSFGVGIGGVVVADLQDEEATASAPLLSIFLLVLGMDLGVRSVEVLDVVATAVVAETRSE